MRLSEYLLEDTVIFIVGEIINYIKSSFPDLEWYLIFIIFFKEIRLLNIYNLYILVQ